MAMMKVVEVQSAQEYDVTMFMNPTFWYTSKTGNIYMTVKDSAARIDVKLTKYTGVEEELNILEDAMTNVGATVIIYKDSINVYNGSAPVPNAVKRSIREYKGEK